jgi:transposase
MIVVICDSARYYKYSLVAKFLETSRIQMESLPSYSSSLNLIEQFWKFFKKKIRCQR